MSRRRAPRLSLDLLRGFRAAARHLSFTAAARELSLTQSAVSQAVKALEEQLGTPLFTRVNRGLQLTFAGERLYRATDEALSLIDATAEDLADAGTGLSITTTVPLASLWLGPRLPEFTRRHPDIRLRLVASNDRIDITREHIDVAIRHVPAGQSPPGGEPIFQHEAFPVCAPSFLRAADPPIASPADLEHHVLLDLETSLNGRPWYDWQRWLDGMEIRRLRAARTLRFSHYDQVIAAAVAGTGIAIGKWPHLATQLRQGALVAPLGTAGIARIGTFYFVAASGAPPGPVDAFRAWLRSEAAEEERRKGHWIGALDMSSRKRADRAPSRRR